MRYDTVRRRGHLLPYPRAMSYPQKFYGRIYIFYHVQGSVTLPDLSVKNPMVKLLFQAAAT